MTENPVLDRPVDRAWRRRGGNACRAQANTAPVDIRAEVPCPTATLGRSYRAFLRGGPGMTISYWGFPDATPVFPSTCGGEAADYGAFNFAALAGRRVVDRAPRPVRGTGRKTTEIKGCPVSRTRPPVGVFDPASEYGADEVPVHAKPVRLDPNFLEEGSPA